MAQTVNWKPHYLYRKFTGEITGEEVLKSNFDIYSHPRFTKIKYIVNDFTDVDSVLLDAEHTRIFAASDDIMSDSKGKFKIAIVSRNDEHIELATSYCTAMKNKLFVCKIFSSVEEAKLWGEQKTA